MTGERAHHSAPGVDDRLCLNDGSQPLVTGQLSTLAGPGMDAHTRQRTLVRASLLMSRRIDPATHGRWA
jgi:hypothetical protein